MVKRSPHNEVFAGGDRGTSRVEDGRMKRAGMLSAAAILASASHVVIDFLVDVYPLTVPAVLAAVAVYAAWVVVLARAASGSRPDTTAAAVFALVVAGLANGIAGLVPCPPTALVGGPGSCPLAPWQDLAHIASFGFGVAAFIVLWRQRDPHERQPRA